jgi:hypothetical protein
MWRKQALSFKSAFYWHTIAPEPEDDAISVPRFRSSRIFSSLNKNKSAADELK